MQEHDHAEDQRRGRKDRAEQGHQSAGDARRGIADVHGHLQRVRAGQDGGEAHRLHELAFGDEFPHRFGIEQPHRSRAGGAEQVDLEEGQEEFEIEVHG